MLIKMTDNKWALMALTLYLFQEPLVNGCASLISRGIS